MLPLTYKSTLNEITAFVYFLLKDITSLSENTTYFITSIGVYANGDMSLNGIAKEDLITHINYNLTNRPGRALFINGICVNKGNLSDKQITDYSNLFKSDSKYTITKITKPYD